MDDWRTRAACRDADPLLFVDHEGERMGPKRQREAAAKAICARCPVRDQCREAGVGPPSKSPQVATIWGGMNEAELATEKRNRPRRVSRGEAA